ncbi:MAG TPA: dienelactone hydrolase family protein [Acidimicrobiia bacterium]|jgi:predicted dienelactone hydrolase|nr:dienelactone hydrolase family protein [Acidimicrobiia bacterium]
MTMTLRGVRRALLSATIAVLATSACSSSGSHSTASPTTTATPASLAPYAKTGPNAVGYTQAKLADGRRLVIWYPAQAGSTAGRTQESIDVGSFLSPALQAKIPPGYRPLYKANAFLDAAPAKTASGYPLVVFSHGFAGFPEQSVTLTTHLASWGFVVAAPNHVERSLDGLLGTAAQHVKTSSDLAVLQATTDAVTNMSQQPGVLKGMIDPNRIVTAGHSAGAGAAYQFASADPRVKAWISYSVGLGGKSGPAPAVPNKPGMVMLGTKDGIIPPAASKSVYAHMKSPKYLVQIGDAGHLVFSDICLIGRSQGGLVGIVHKINLPIPDSLLKLGSDGCTKDHPLPEKAFPAIDQLSVAFFRSALGIDPKAVGLDTEAVKDLGATVTVQSG